MIEFEDKYVHFRWTEEVKGKKGFVADNMDELQKAFEEKTFNIVKGFRDEAFPFQTDRGFFRFAYYDPNYDCKIAFNKGKKIQLHTSIGEWVDIDDPDWSDDVEYRIKPSKPALKWTDLKLGDIIKKDKRTAMVTDIVADEDTDKHIYAGCRWFSDDYLELWENDKTQKKED